MFFEKTNIITPISNGNNDIKKISKVFFEKLLFGSAEFVIPGDNVYILPGEYI